MSDQYLVLPFGFGGGMPTPEELARYFRTLPSLMISGAPHDTEEARSLWDKLRPGKLQTTPRVFAIMAYLLGGGKMRWTTNPINHMFISSDSRLFADGRIIGTDTDLQGMVQGVCQSVQATPRELEYLMRKAFSLRS